MCTSVLLPGGTTGNQPEEFVRVEQIWKIQKNSPKKLLVQGTQLRNILRLFKKRNYKDYLIQNKIPNIILYLKYIKYEKIKIHLRIVGYKLISTDIYLLLL